MDKLVNMKILFSNKLPDTKPTGKVYEHRDIYSLEEHLTVWIDYIKIVIPVGFETDFGSIPRGFWNFFLPTEVKCSAAYILHDFLYCTKYFNRSTCDNILLQSLKTLGIGYLKRHMIYFAVRIGGEMPWENERMHKIFDVRHLAGITSISIPVVEG